MASQPTSDKPAPERIQAPNDLSKKVRKMSAAEAAKFDPVKAAEEAIEKLSDQFESWMGSEIDCLKTANDAAQAADFSTETYDALFRCAHDIKGQAETLGFPLIGRVANNLTTLLIVTHTQASYPKELIAQHVNAIRAMISEDARDSTSKLGVALVTRLEEASKPLTQLIDS